MWIRFLCWWLGHKTMIKAFTGETYLATNRLTMGDEKVSLYKWQKEPRCIRCGAGTLSEKPTSVYGHDDLVELGALANWEVMGDWERRQKAAGILRRIGFLSMVHEYEPKKKEATNGQK